MSTSKMLPRALGAATLGASLMMLTAPNAAATPTPPAFSLTGTGAGLLNPLGPDWKDHRVRFQVNAKGDPGAAKGRVHVTHWTPDGEVFADFTAKVDCVVVNDGIAVATAVVDQISTHPPGTTLPLNRRVGITVHDKRAGDTLGWSWSVGGFDTDVLPCTSTVPIIKLSQGNYRTTGSLT